MIRVGPTHDYPWPYSRTEDAQWFAEAALAPCSHMMTTQFSGQGVQAVYGQHASYV